jgi:hypothetical protein
VGYQLEEIVDSKQIVFFSVESPLADAIRVYRVRCIPSMLPAYRKRQDELYLRTQPGLFPDLLEPISECYRLPASNTLNALWLEVDPKGNFPAGRYPITCIFSDSQNRLAEITCVLEILPASLPEQKENRYEGYMLTGEDIYIIACFVWAEARNEPPIVQQAVAEVVLNRVMCDKYPNTVKDIMRKTEFYRSLDDITRLDEPELDQYIAVDAAMYGPYILPEDVCFYATWDTGDNLWGTLGSYSFFHQE